MGKMEVAHLFALNYILMIMERIMLTIMTKDVYVHVLLSFSLFLSLFPFSHCLSASLSYCLSVFLSVALFDWLGRQPPPLAGHQAWHTPQHHKGRPQKLKKKGKRGGWVETSGRKGDGRTGRTGSGGGLEKLFVLSYWIDLSKRYGLKEILLFYQNPSSPTNSPSQPPPPCLRPPTSTLADFMDN